TVEVIKDKVTDSKKRAKVVMVRDEDDHSWFDSYGNAVNPTSDVYGSEEIGPVSKTVPKAVRQRHQRIDLGVRYVLYNKKSEKVVFDRTTYIGAALSTYSKRPSIAPARIKTQLMGHLMQRIARDVCPRIGHVERSLYAMGTGSSADKL